MKKKSTNKTKIVLWFFVLAVLGILTIALIIQYEGERPVVEIDLPVRSIGLSTSMSGTVSDRKSGIKSIWIAISQAGADHVLVDKTFHSNVLSRGDRTYESPVEFVIEPQRLGLIDGPVLLRIRVSDCSFRNWFSGNITYIEKELLIDTKPPEIDVLSKNHNLVRGGAGLAIYRVSEAGGPTGVHVGDDFYPGYTGYFKDPDIFLSFFALNHKQGPGTNMYIEATDSAGNSARAGFVYYIGHKNYKDDKIPISDSFLNAKMPEFSVKGFAENEDNLAKFLKINGDIRRENGETIMNPATRTEKQVLWKDAFLRLPGSATRANFADHRSYMYKGKKVDDQYHLGFDLASIKQAPVPAANSGKIALIDTIGIYGKTIVIDHGFGLFSTYSHLSRVGVNEGENVGKGDVIGNTGITGLTGGDHLHYGMFIDHTFVDPLQWWDQSWIDNNITSKLSDIKSGQ
ncbi:MAG: M23 family metallopeptidase [Proteobacteria bacterium]|nr:M23 family metallopeptidase [Pseudomonadota bacterium]